jgi:hypothetical protein
LPVLASVNTQTGHAFTRQSSQVIREVIKLRLSHLQSGSSLFLTHTREFKGELSCREHVALVGVLVLRAKVDHLIKPRVLARS